MRHLPDTEFCRVLRSAVRRSIELEQRHWPRRRADILRSLRCQQLADRFFAFERQWNLLAV